MRKVRAQRGTQIFVLAAVVLLAGCAGSVGGGGEWIKPGADQSAMADAYRECQALSQDAVSTEAHVNDDIAATRGNDWERASVAGQQKTMMRDELADRRANIVESCMLTQGFSHPKK